MREFSIEEKLFILHNQSKMSLKNLAIYLDCSCDDVYKCYSDLLSSMAYRRQVEKERNRIINRLHKEDENDH